MSGVFQNIDPRTPLTTRRLCIYPPDTLAGWKGGWGVNNLEDARHSSVLYICKYFVSITLLVFAQAGRVCDPIGGEYRSSDTWNDRPHHLAGQMSVHTRYFKRYILVFKLYIRVQRI
jgi:hypothetical protein